MDKVSILMPSRNETYKTNFGITVLQQTIKDILKNATGDYEILVMFDGEPYQELPDDPHIRVFYGVSPKGSRYCLNLLANVANGKYLFKLDSHCMLSKGFDEVLQSEIEDNWVVIPRMYILNAEEWKWQDERFYDYFYLPCPFTDKKLFRFQAGGHWKERTAERLSIPIDENMKLHGSGFFLSKDFFLNKLGGLQMKIEDNSSGEDIEISLKTWLGGGKLIVNKNAWYAHMHKGGQRPRGWDLSGNIIRRDYLTISNYWMKNSWKERKYDLEWLIEKFSPVPTWPDNWREVWKEWKNE